VAYGDVAATRDDAMLARSTDDTLRTSRPVLSPARRDQPKDDRKGGRPPAAPTRSESGTPSVWMTGVGS